MASKRPKKIDKTGMLLGGICHAVQFIDLARGTADPNERLKSIVQAVSVNGANTPLEPSSKEIITTQRTALTERPRVSGELRPVHQAFLRTKCGGGIIQISWFGLKPETSNPSRSSAKPTATWPAPRGVSPFNLSRGSNSLRAKNIEPREKLDKAKAEVAAATARLDSLSAEVEITCTVLRDAEVHAPFDDVVAKLTVNEGSYVGADVEPVRDSVTRRAFTNTTEPGSHYQSSVSARAGL